MAFRKLLTENNLQKIDIASSYFSSLPLAYDPTMKEEVSKKYSFISSRFCNSMMAYTAKNRLKLKINKNHLK